MNDDEIFCKMITVALLTTLVFTMPINFINAKQVCERTTLYTLTSHPQAEHTILCHPIGNELVKANNANIAFNHGLISGQHSSLIKCPINDKSSNFCDGWNYAKSYLK